VAVHFDRSGVALATGTVPRPCDADPVRADGKMIFDRCLARVKTPAEPRNEWDLLEILHTIPGAEGFRP
jgi:hypothetical protein